MTVRSAAAALGLALLYSLSGCSGCDDIVTTIDDLCIQGKCESTAGCQACGKMRHECVKPADDPAGLGVCVEQPMSCNLEADCCPGESCNQVKICADRYTQCTQDPDCTVPGQVCREFETFRHDEQGAHIKGKRCTFDRCGTPGNTCGEGLHCFAGYCIGKDAFTVSAPGKTRLCGGGCGDGEVCVPVNGRCMKAPPECTERSCAPGLAVTFVDPANVDDHCDTAKRQCACSELPPLDAKDLGRYSALVVGATEIMVSAYDGTYGDLVLVHYSLEGVRQSVEYLDGVPDTGVVVAGPSGARGGISDPGDDVGRHTDIVLDAAGNPHISYYDGTNGDLKIAYYNGTAWQKHTVDGNAPAADVGLYTSIRIINGKPAIAYFQKAGAGTSDLKTGVRFAWANVAAPASSADWNIKLVDSADRPQPPCYSPRCAAATETCVQGGANGTCRTLETGCTPACASSEACVSVTGGGKACETKLAGESAANGDTPEGLGLMPSLAAMQDGSPIIAYYDRLQGALKAVKADPVGNFPAAGAIPYLDGKTDSMTDLWDVGQFPSLLVKPDNTVAIAYTDATHDDLLYWTAAAPALNIRPSIIDDGNPSPGSGDLRLVGADASLTVSDTGVVYVAYQDSTRSNLRVKRLAGSAWQSVLEVGEGAVGFFADAASKSGKVYVSHVRIVATPAGLENTIRIERIEAP